MKTLLSERYAPITSSLGFLRVSLDEAVDALAGWRRSLVDGMVSVEDAGPFPEYLRRQEPLIGGARPRELRTEFLNYERTVSSTFDGSRWVFSADGTEQWFEETEAYKARRIRDQFTSENAGALLQGA